jgi:hypothetical protein
MRVLIVGAGSGASSIGGELEAAGIEVEHRADDPSPADGSQEITEIASDLREFEATLGGPGADAVLIGSESAAALAAVVVATKMGVPVASLLAPEEAGSQGANARVIRQLADAALAPDATAVVQWLRGGYPARA